MCRKWLVAVSILSVNVLAASGAAAQTSQDELKKQFAETYAQIAFLNYQDALNSVAELEEKVEAFIESPSAESMDAAKHVWLESRIPYGQTEVFRFADGPIDGTNEQGEEGPEGRINAWPLNEAYIDYVKDNPTSGIIQDTAVVIDDNTLSTKNQSEDEADVTTGYHAIEFLLWGQDFNTAGPGDRPFSDYGEDDPIKERRGEYLEEAAELLIKDLSGIVEAWAPNGAYRQKFVTSAGDDVLTNALTSLATLSAFELASERIATALDSGDQEDEHSCFSDNTHVDFKMNAQGIDNVYYGRYGSYQGTGLNKIAEAVDPELAKKIGEQLAKTKSIVEGIKPPIDQILASPAESADRQTLEALVQSLQAQAELFIELGKKLGLTVAIKS